MRCLLDYTARVLHRARIYIYQAAMVWRVEGHTHNVAEGICSVRVQLDGAGTARCTHAHLRGTASLNRLIIDQTRRIGNRSLFPLRVEAIFHTWQYVSILCQVLRSNTPGERINNDSVEYQYASVTSFDGVK